MELRKKILMINNVLLIAHIVLPGSLVALAFRWDVVLQHTATHNGKRQSYFPWMCVAYGIGLAMAMVATGVFESWQPTMFYTMPCTVGMFVAVSKYNGEFHQIWTKTPTSLALLPPLATPIHYLNKQM